jgi:hypothetical protein
MNGIIRHAALGASLSAALAALTGCVPEYRELVDTCWPERYSYQARNSVRESFNNQAANGHALDQTMWNQYFESGGPRLTKAGEEHLKYLARRRPVPDPHLYVQTSYDAKGERAELDRLRVQAVQNYLASLMANHNVAVTFEVTVHDAPEPGLPARPAPNLYVRPVSAAVVPPPNAQGTTGQPGTQSNPPTGTQPNQGAQGAVQR